MWSDWFPFPGWWIMLSILLFGHLRIFFGEVSIHIPYKPFFNCFLLLSCRRSLCILDINCLLDTWFSYYFHIIQGFFPFLVMLFLFIYFVVLPWTQGLRLARLALYHLSHVSNPVWFGHLLPRLTWTVTLLFYHSYDCWDDRCVPLCPAID
jgi:hypothetical protein